MRRLSLLTPIFMATALAAQIPTGPAVGQQVEEFRATDQNGQEQTLRSVLGPKGGLLVFFRSADW
jgi:hypothetical protein